jgi:hypothetical protein
VFTIRTPNSVDNADVSIPHRILAILLSRNLLKNYTLAEEGVNKLLDGSEMRITIKPEATALPVFLAAKPRG